MSWAEKRTPADVMAGGLSVDMCFLCTFFPLCSHGLHHSRKPICTSLCQLVQKSDLKRLDRWLFFFLFHFFQSSCLSFANWNFLDRFSLKFSYYCHTNTFQMLPRIHIKAVSNISGAIFQLKWAHTNWAITIFQFLSMRYVEALGRQRFH